MNQKTQVIYWTAQLYNSDQDQIDAIITEQFDAPLIEKCTDYVLAVERFEVNLNGVPFIVMPNGQAFAITFYESVPGQVVQVNLNTVGQSYYSQIQLLDKIQTALDNNPDLLKFGFQINMDAYGFIYFSWNATDVGDNTNNITQVTFAIDDGLNEYLGMNVDNVDVANRELKSTYPRFDTGDLCEHVRLVSNMMLVSDTSGQAKTNIVTDVAAIMDYQSTVSGLPNRGGATSFSQSMRQKLCYQPPQRRWLNFAAPVAMTYISIWVEYVKPNGESTIIPLPRGAMFSIKLGFYYKQ